MIFSICFIVTCVLALLVCVLALIKNENTYRNQTLICAAIALHHLDMIDAGHFGEYEVDFSDEEPYIDTLKRWWDWGYTRILPPEKFEIIKPYIEEAKKRWFKRRGLRRHIGVIDEWSGFSWDEEKEKKDDQT